MEWISPAVFLIAHTVPDKEVAAAWVESMGFNPDTIDSGGALSGAEELIAWAGKRCYLSFDVGVNPNLTKIRKDWLEYFDNLLVSGHGSVLEHASFTFALEGVSRVFTGEMNRHRAGVAISEGSMRYIRMRDGLVMTLPPSLEDPNMDETRSIMERVVDQIHAGYMELCELHKDTLENGNFAAKKELTSLFRRILPMGIATGGLWTLNLRALRHVLTMRCSPQAEEEICMMAFKIAALMAGVLEVGISDFKVVDGKYLVPSYVKV